MGMYCRQCQYDLRGQIEFRCPECGRDYDPEDPSTFEDALPSSPKRFLLRLRRSRVVLIGVATLALAAYSYHIGSQIPTSSRGKSLRGWVSTLHAFKIIGEWSRQQDTSPRACFDVEAAKTHMWPSCSVATYEMCGPRWDASNTLRVAPSFLWPAAIYGVVVAVLVGRRSRWPVAIWYSVLLAIVGAHYYPSVFLDRVWPQSYDFLDDYVYVCGADLNGNGSDPDDRVVLYAKERTVVLYSSRGDIELWRDVGYADRSVLTRGDETLARQLDKQGVDVDPDSSLLDLKEQNRLLEEEFLRRRAKAKKQ